MMSGKWKNLAHKAAKSVARKPVLRSSMIEGVQVRHLIIHVVEALVM